MIRNNILTKKYNEYIKLIKTLLLGISISVLITDSMASDSIRYNIYLTNKVQNQRPTSEQVTQFDCSDRIHIVVTAIGLSQEKHELKVKWIDPVETQRELTRYDFYGQTNTHIWAWLQLHGPTGAIIGQMFDPSFGMEEFIGEWRAEVFIDGKQVSSQPFQVLC